MPETFKKDDIRIIKTEKALNIAMFDLLERKNFGKITVSDICTKAQISRATFYAHFNDKYDLLKYILMEISVSVVKNIYEYDELEKGVNQFIHLNKKVITNVLKEANSETLALIREFISSIVDHAIKRKISDETSSDYIILLNFLTGGLINVLTWIVENNFPPEIRMINTSLYEILDIVTSRDLE